MSTDHEMVNLEQQITAILWGNRTREATIAALLLVVERATVRAQQQVIEQAAADMLETDPHDPVEFLRGYLVARADELLALLNGTTP